MSLLDGLAHFTQALLNALGNSTLNVEFGSTMLLACGLLALVGYNRGWHKTFSRKMFAGSATSMGVWVLDMVFVPLVYLAITSMQTGYDALGIPKVPISFWEGVPFWAAGLFAIALYDFANYWSHRVMHMRWLFPIHAIHHSDEEVNGFTTFRIHFLEALIMKAFYVLMVSWAGFSAEAASFGALILLLHNVYVHADLDWDHGPFKYLVASPRYHRWHHANKPEAFGKNLANLMPIYDYMFGTYYNPGVCREPMGADGVPHADVISLMLFPLTEWSRMIKEALRRAPVKTSREFLDPAE